MDNIFMLTIGFLAQVFFFDTHIGAVDIVGESKTCAFAHNLLDAKPDGSLLALHLWLVEK